jgi:hypothetical protein
MIKIYFIIAIIIFGCLQSSFGQTQKIKVKKAPALTSEFKSDSCNFKVIIAADIFQKKLPLQSIDMEDISEREISRAESFKPILFYINQTIDITPVNIQSIFKNVCKVNAYRLKVVQVTKHITKNPAFENKVAVFLTYGK